MKKPSPNRQQGHPNSKHSLQYADELIVVTVLYPPHTRAAAIIIQEIKAQVDRLRDSARTRLSTGTRRISISLEHDLQVVTRLSNSILGKLR